MSSYSYSILPILYQVPYLLVFGIGIVVSLVYIGRHPLPAILMLLGCGLNQLLAVVVLALPYLHRGAGASEMMIPIYLISNVLRAIGVGLMIVSAFSSRSVLAENPLNRN